MRIFRQAACVSRSNAVLLFLSLTFALEPMFARASTAEPSGINLGDTSFLDGFAINKPAVIYQQYFSVANYSALNDATGHNVPVFKDPSISAVVSVNQFIYVSPCKLFSGSVGIDVLLPVVDLNASFATNSPTKLVANKGLALGDVTWGPFIEFPAVFSGGRPVFDSRVEFDVISPIGLYDARKDINPGSGFWSINPHWETTVLPTPNTEISARLHYLHNFENQDAASSDPFVSGTHYTAGDAFWVNVTASYKVARKLYFGLNGYYFKQFTDDKVRGVGQKGTQTTNLSIGPGTAYLLDTKNYFYTNVYVPVVEKNTPSGVHLVFRWAHVF